MSKSRIFEYAIIQHPEPENDNAKQPPSVLIQAPTCVLASDQQQATILAAREIPDDLLDKLDEVEIAIRPF